MNSDFNTNWTNISKRLNGAPLAFISAGALVVGYYVFFAAKKPKIYTKNQKLKRLLVDHVPSIHETYWPCVLWEGRLQTILMGTKFIRTTVPRVLPYKREIFKLKDGGELALDYLEPEPSKKKNIKILFVPGLTSSSQSNYVRTIAQTLQVTGYSVIVMNHRGVGGVRFKTPRTYSSSNTEDLLEVITHLGKKFPNEKMCAMGASLGSMLLASFLRRHPQESKDHFSFAVFISLIWDANISKKSLEKPFINLYMLNYNLTKGLVKLGNRMKENVGCLPAGTDEQGMRNSKTISEFDEAITRRYFGFNSVEHYYSYSSTAGNTHEISIPTFVINAEDDPMSPKENLPFAELQEKDTNVVLIATARGGHIGFLEGLTGRREHLLERMIVQIVNASIEHLDYDT